jgi:protein-S-isoprenylcysteine O-methyltransferase Ste14
MMDWPALIIGVVLSAYWGRVLRLVYKIRRQTGQSANFRPTERLGQMLRIIWYPAVFVWAFHPYATAFGARLPATMKPLWVQPLLAWAAVAVSVAALAGTLVCWKRMGKSWRMGINPDEKTQLIVTGPYGYVRHPIYALSSVLMVTTMVVVPSPLMLAAGAIHLTLLQWEARREEKYLAVHHGQCYVDYCRQVGRFVPGSLRPYDAGT